VDLKDIKAIIDLMKKNSISEFEMEKADFKIRLKRGLNGNVALPLPEDQPSALLAVQRSAAVDAADGVPDSQRLSGLDPAGIFLGKAAAVAVQLLVLEAILAVGVVVLYDLELRDPATLVTTALAATVGLAAAGTLYGVLAAGLRVRETLLPLLLLPVVAPVLIAATQASDAALTGLEVAVEPGDWLRLLVVFAVVYLAFGVAAYGPLLEEA